jgi:DNA-binding transcriptional MerR regulator
MTNFSIKDLSDFSGIKQHTIRIWEQRFDFLQPKRNDAFRRLYSIDQLNVFLDASLLNKSGYKVSRIARMSPDEKFQLVSNMDTDCQQLKAVNDLIIFMAEMDTVNFEQVLDRSILTFGIHNSIRNVILPFAERVGLFQKLDGKSYIENIAMVRESIRQKIYLGISKAGQNKDAGTTVLLFLPQGEYQELCLLCLQYELKLQGFTVINLGCSVSVDTLSIICDQKRPDFIVTSLQEKYSRKEMVKFVSSLPSKFPQMNFIAIGNPVPVQGSNDHLLHADDYTQAMKLIANKD